MQKVIFFIITLLSSVQVGAMDVVTVPKKYYSKKEKAYNNEQLARALYVGQSVEVIKKLPSFEPDCFLSLKYLVKPISASDEKAWAKRGSMIKAGKSRSDYDERLSFLAYFLIGGRKNVTPLQLAVWQGHAHLVRFLLEHGANVNLLSFNPYARERARYSGSGHYKNHPTTTKCCFVRPLDIALLVGKADVAQILLEYGAVSTCHPAIAAALWPEFVEYCNARGISPYKKEFQKSIFNDETNQGFNAFFSELVEKYYDSALFNERVLKATLDSGAMLPVKRGYTVKEALSVGYLPWLNKALIRKNEGIVTLLLTYPFLVPLLPDYEQAKKRIVTALMIFNRYSKNLPATHGAIPPAIFYLILRSTQDTALDMLSVLTGRLFERKTIEQGLVICRPAQKEALRTLLTRYDRVLPLPCVLPLLRDNFIEQQQQFLVRRSIVVSFPQLDVLDLLGDGFKKHYGERIMANIWAQLCTAPHVELLDRAEHLSVSLRGCDISGRIRIYFDEPAKPYYEYVSGGSSGGC